MQSFDVLDKKLLEMRKQMSVAANPSNGDDGTETHAGTNPGAGSGPGTGTGGDLGGAKPTEQEKRMMRWSMRFNTLNGGDYLRQLEGLGAVLAIPDRGDSYKVVDLTQKPFHAKNQDVSTIKKIWWFDKNPQSVERLMTAMGPSFNAKRVVAFIPQEVEAELAKKELETGIKVDDVFATTFGVRVPGADGRKYDLWVISQTTKEEMKRVKR